MSVFEMKIYLFYHKTKYFIIIKRLPKLYTKVKEKLSDS
jgi:hypothetical protein